MPLALVFLLFGSLFIFPVKALALDPREELWIRSGIIKQLAQRSQWDSWCESDREGKVRFPDLCRSAYDKLREAERLLRFLPFEHDANLSEFSQDIRKQAIDRVLPVACSAKSSRLRGWAMSFLNTAISGEGYQSTTFLDEVALSSLVVQISKSESDEVLSKLGDVFHRLALAMTGPEQALTHLRSTPEKVNKMAQKLLQSTKSPALLRYLVNALALGHQLGAPPLDAKTIRLLQKLYRTYQNDGTEPTRCLAPTGLRTLAHAIAYTMGYDGPTHFRESFAILSTADRLFIACGLENFLQRNREASVPEPAEFDALLQTVSPTFSIEHFRRPPTCSVTVRSELPRGTPTPSPLRFRHSRETLHGI